MDAWQRNMRMIHQISEFVDFDSAESDLVADFISLIQAMREGLTQIDDDFNIPDSQINTLFLTKLKARSEWDEWATTMLRDNRINAPNPEHRMTFQELSELAIDHERVLRGGKGRYETRKVLPDEPLSIGPPPSNIPTVPEDVTQDDINAFVVQQMSQEDGYPRRRHTVRGHNKNPSQEEINDYVIHQMRRNNEPQKPRNRSQSQPEPRSQNHLKKSAGPRCTFCGDPHHQTNHCWRRWRVAVEAPPGDFVPKRIEYRTEIPGQPPMYRTGFTLY
ncbi:hypothetical protein P170DRAFT_438614 [Aspergillus steynii IBT 23096]|uniref:Uncharacterized protein n=1 Tax=Aspergillus steynii IBT 23096 TaxID=1392250 RepID=A0A2I2G1Z8_9EURO|nr:uncharacterized protein P170DRAFT_438614 [Aspergillus steynii IBT 23096]PLB46912.1 hypothetical protein P170DRAFT_438614 [Aspergillus steynii IBT 23096]